MVNFWPHLNNIHDQRGEKYSKILNVTLDDSVVDLNCGLAPVFKFVKAKYYYGNDILEDFVNVLSKYNTDQVKFELKKDTEVDIEVDIQECTVLILLGSTAGTWASSHSHCESQNDIKTFSNIMKKFKPRIALIEYANCVNANVDTMMEGYNCEKIFFDFNEVHKGNFMKRTLLKFTPL